MYDNSGPVLATGLVLFVTFVVRVLELVSMHGGTIILLESGLNLFENRCAGFSKSFSNTAAPALCWRLV